MKVARIRAGDLQLELADIAHLSDGTQPIENEYGVREAVCHDITQAHEIVRVKPDIWPTWDKKVVMIVDDFGLVKKLPVNDVGCFYQGTERHGHPIVGNIAFLCEREGEGNGLYPLTEHEAAQVQTFWDMYASHGDRRWLSTIYGIAVQYQAQ